MSQQENLNMTPLPELDIEPIDCVSASEAVLQKVGKPLGYVELTRLSIYEKLWVTHGKTPEATVNARLAVDIKKYGDNSRFQRTAPGVFALRSWGLPEHKLSAQNKGKIENHQSLSGNAEQPISLDLNRQINEHNQKIAEGLHLALSRMIPAEFERLIGDLLTAVGFEDVEVTNHHSDGGIDVRGVLVVGGVIRTKMAVQVKRWKNNVQAPIVQQVRGSLGTHDQGLIITTSSFSPGAREEANRSNAIPVALMGGRQLVQLLIENNLGVRRMQHDLLELDVIPL